MYLIWLLWCRWARAWMNKHSDNKTETVKLLICPQALDKLVHTRAHTHTPALKSFIAPLEEALPQEAAVALSSHCSTQSCQLHLLHSHTSYVRGHITFCFTQAKSFIFLYQHISAKHSGDREESTSQASQTPPLNAKFAFSSFSLNVCDVMETTTRCRGFSLDVPQSSHHSLTSPLLYSCVCLAVLWIWITALQVLTLLNVKDISNKMCMQKRKPLLLLQARIFVVRSLLSDFLCQSQWGRSIGMQATQWAITSQNYK